LKLSPQELTKWFSKFRKTVWFRVVLLAVLGVIVGELFQFFYSSQVTACLGILLMPAVVFVVPYYLGERSTKNLALNGIPVFIVAVLFVAAMTAQATTAPNTFDLTSGVSPSETNLPALSLWNGTVTPARATPPANFNFTVRLKTDPVNLPNVTVYLNLTTLQGLSGSLHSYTMSTYSATANGTWYTLTRHLDPGIYEFWFWTNDTKGNYTVTIPVIGPLTAGYFDYFGIWAQYFALNLAIPFSFYYVILFMYWYTGRMRRMRARMIDTGLKAKEGKAEKEQKPKVASGGKAAKVTAFTCTNCGADVDESDEKCPKCGAVFED
jgi:hypothetical protein